MSLRHVLASLSSLPNLLLHLSLLQRETNSLLRELIIAITTQPPETARTEIMLSPVGLPVTSPSALMDPQPMPSPRLTSPKRRYTDRDVHVPQTVQQIVEGARRDAQTVSHIPHEPSTS